MLAAVSALSFAQSTDLVITPRFEGEMTKFDKEQAEFGFGMSSLYTFVDGTFKDERFSYSASFHLLSSDPKSLYSYESPCMNGTPVDWAYFAYDGDIFGASVGKIIFNTGLFEFDANDVDCYSPMVSSTWNNCLTYQYGVAARLTPWEGQSFEAQFTSSPLMVKFSDKDFAWSLNWRGEFGKFSTNVAFNRQRYTVETGVHDFVTMFTVSAKYDFEKCNVSVETTNGGFGKFSDWSGSEFLGRVNFTGHDLFHAGALLGLQYLHKAIFGLYVECYPLHSEDLRIHGAVSRRSFLPEVGAGYPMATVASLGVTYNLNFHFGK